MRAAALLLTAALAGSGAGTARPADLGTLAFRSIGPSVSGGRMGDVAGTDADPMLYYAGAAGGGIWKSADGGIHWAPVFDAAPVAPIGALAIDPSDPNVVWAGTGEAAPRNDVSYGNGVYKTADGGKTWRHLGLDATSQISRILIDPHDGNHVLVAALGDPFRDSAQRGVYETRDGGATWKKTLYIGASSGASDIAWNPAHPQTVFAGMWQFRRTGWSMQSGGPDDGVYKSADGGATWTRLHGSGLPGGEEGRIGLAVAGTRVYAMIQSLRGLLWRSDDGGASWQFVTANTIVNERPFYFSRMGVDPADPNHAFALSVEIAETFDGGKTWKATGRNLGSDHHAIWISANGKRIVQGGDKGVALSLDGGKRWVRVNLLPVAQAYHVSYDRSTPYTLCVGLQDNGTWCGPSNSLSADGILAHYWQKISGGDGTWAYRDPLVPALVWYSSGGGSNGGDLWLYDSRSRQDIDISPYLRDQNVWAPKVLKYRFNWESPIAFDPFDPHVAYYGGNVVFQTRDRGRHWRVVSPDLTRNIKAHQRITGGITNEGTGAETADTILALAPSALKRGLIWAGTDDGKVQLTRDAGAHWIDVSIPGCDASSRVESIQPSRFSAAVAYASVDRHMAGDRRPYIYRTGDYGVHWRAISSNLPRDQFVRAVRQDPKNSALLYAGLEQSFWASWNGGRSWSRIAAGLPPASYRDIRIQPDANDIILSTHGRGIYIFDDATAIQRLPSIESAGRALLPVRTAYLYNYHEDTFDLLAAGENPPAGALITIYQRTPGSSAPSVQVLDARGRIVRHLQAKNSAGFQRIAWALCDDPPQPWLSAAPWNRGESCGAFVVPGTYRVRARIGAKTFEQTAIVRGAPFFRYSARDYAARHDLEATLFGLYDGIDRTLNRLDSMRDKLSAADARTRARLDAMADALSANMQNGQDDDFLTDRLRERVQSLLGSLDGSFGQPTAEQYREARVLAARYRAIKREYGGS